MTLVPLLLAPVLMIGVAIGGYAIFSVTDPKKKPAVKTQTTAAAQADRIA